MHDDSGCAKTRESLCDLSRERDFPNECLQPSRSHVAYKWEKLSVPWFICNRVFLLGDSARCSLQSILRGG